MSNFYLRVAYSVLKVTQALYEIIVTYSIYEHALVILQREENQYFFV